VRVSDRGLEARVRAAGLRDRSPLRAARHLGHRHRAGGVPLHVRRVARAARAGRGATSGPRRCWGRRRPGRTRCRTCCRR
jgi:hypothetical protein